MEGPLTELRNQRLPRRKMAQTYGKKKASGISVAHRDLFGADSDDIETGLAELSLEDQNTPIAAPRTAIRKNSKSSTANTAIAQTPLSMKPQLISQGDAAVVEPLLSLSEAGVELFSTFSSKLLKSFDIEKIGEGSFAEVFKVVPRPRFNTLTASSQPIPFGGAIIKVIPLDIPSSNPETMDRLSSVDSVVREIKILRSLDSIHGFTRFRGVRLVTGVWPPQFLSAFRAFRRAHRSRAMNPAPDEDFSENQIYALVEMDDAGSEISLLKRPNVFQVYDTFWMTAVLLANAEEQVEFEHRDLHLSNICVKPFLTAPRVEDHNEPDFKGRELSRPIPDINPSLLSSMTDSNVPVIKLGLSNLRLTLIDYTVTRCLLSPGQNITKSSSNPNDNQEIAFDHMVFLSGPLSHTDSDGESNLQLATYRKTRAAVQLAQSLTNVQGFKWKQFVPRTNVIWLAYLLQTMSRRAKGRCKKYYIVKGSSKVAKRVQEEMWDVLGDVQDVVCGVDPEDEGDDEASARGAGKEETKEFSDEELERTPASARELLGRAVGEGWLSKEEVEAFKARLESDS